MKFTIHPETFSQMLDFATRYIAKNATLPILQHVYLQAKEDTLTVVSTDMEKYINIQQPVDIDQEGTITVDAQSLYRIVNLLKGDAVQVIYQEDTEHLQILTQDDKFEFHTIPAHEYVAAPKLTPTMEFSLPTKTVAKGIEKVINTIAEKNFSPVFTWVYMYVKNPDQYTTEPKPETSQIFFVWTDSFALCEYTIPLPKTMDHSPAVIIPKPAATDFLYLAKKCMGGENNTINIQTSKNMIAYSYTYQQMKIYTTSILIQGNFPDYKNEKITPTTFNDTFKIDKQSLYTEIQKLAVLSNSPDNLLKVSIAWSTLTLSHHTFQKKGQGETTLPIEKENNTEMTIFLNGKHFVGFLDHMKSDVLVMKVTDENRPLLLLDKDDPRYTAVLRPLKV